MLFFSFNLISPSIAPEGFSIFGAAVNHLCEIFCNFFGRSAGKPFSGIRKKIARRANLWLHGRRVACIKAVRVRLPTLSLLLILVVCALALPNAQAAGLSKAETRFIYLDENGKVQSAEVVSGFTGRMTNPFPHLDPRLARAATIAEERAHAHSRSRCWRYVKEALLASGAVDSYPQTAYARQAGDELVRRYGFKRLAVRDPYQAPVGAVLVYGSGRAAGHVEIRTKHGFVSDFRTPTPSRRPLIGIYAKTSS